MTTYKYCILLLTFVVSFLQCPVFKFNLIISMYVQEETSMCQVPWDPLLPTSPGGPQSILPARKQRCYIEETSGD